MRQNVAPTALSIKIVTAFILLLTVGMLLGAFFKPVLLLGGLILIIIDLFCYISAPIAYELTGNRLTIISRTNKKVFGPIISCSLIGDEKPSFTIRLWGNGGLFAGTGIFWNKKYGIFRAYVSTGEKSYLVLVDTPSTKIIVTPENPERFVAHSNSSKSIHG